MLNSLFKRIVRKLIKSRILIVDPGDEVDVDNFYDWLYSDSLGSKMKKIVKKVALGAGIIAVICIAIMFICNQIVVNNAKGKVFILDGKGYRTICSVVNANKVYGLKIFTIISQKFHNERAIYQAEHLGLDVENIQAYNARDPKSRWAYLTTIREYFARVKMFLDLLTNKE